jgi:serpin B
MMFKSDTFGYVKGEGVQVLEMPYKGDALSMVVLLPEKADGLGDLEKSLSAEKIDGWLKALRQEKVEVYLPRFQMTVRFELSRTLAEMGMPLAFSRGADFSGMDGTKDLFISNVIHKAFVDVNEKGTEAAAATAVVMTLGAMPEPPPVFRADHPFLFLIRDKKSGSILFMGRLVNPKG